MSKSQNYIYLDNFRGFENTVIPLLNMNFLVGENSSGKSSVLSLIKIITSQNFWFTFEFKTDEVNLGQSKDIISASSSDKTYFRVGYLKDLSKESIENRKNLLSRSFLLTFKNNNGIPEPSILSLVLEKNKVLHIKITKTNASYRLDKSIDVKIENITDAQFLFDYLVDFHKKNKGFKKVNNFNSDNFDFRAPVYYAIEEIRKSGEVINNILDIFPVRNSPVWLAPIRSRPKRTYDEPNHEFSPEGDHTPYLISKMMASQKYQDLIRQIEKTAKDSGLFNKLSLKRYGTGNNAPFELDVILDDNPLSIFNVGYGVSQSLPILTEVATRPNKCWFIIQQPEVHLHPKAQAEIGEMLYTGVEKWQQTFLVETHSDHMIDRYRLKKYKEFNIEKTNQPDPNSQILFFQRKNGKNYVFPILISNKGEIDINQPEEYRDFFIKEQIELLGI